MIDKKYPNIKGGFIHVPFIAEQVVDKPNQPCRSFVDITKSLEKAIEAIVLFQDKEDLKTIEGTTH